LEVSAEVRLGLSSEALLEAIQEHDPDLVVLGTRGHTGLKHLLLGSTAERVVQHSPCPVLTIHPGDVDLHRRMRTILIPTDFSAESVLAHAPALRLIQPREGARIILLNVYHLPYEYTVYGTIPTALNFREDVQAKSEERLEELAAPLRAEGVDIETVTTEGYPPEVIVEEAAMRNVDLIAMGTHGRSGIAHLLLGSTTRRVVQLAPCPVLTMRRQDED
jgi:nucleotide-binding universal stress UspA family protein